MKTVTSISGGQTSAYLAANYPTDYNVFALVRIEDQRCLFPDKVLRQRVEDRIQAPFIATVEDDTIIHTIFDLEQFIGNPITWVTGITFDELILKRGNYLPNRISRYCTTELKLMPIFYWWQSVISEPIQMNIGYRANEMNRAANTNEKLNKNGLLEMKHPIKGNGNRNKWITTEWQKPEFPLIKNAIFKSDIIKYWKDKQVRFAPKNNCIGCFWRNPLLLKKMQQLQPKKFQWFVDMEANTGGRWRADSTYASIQSFTPQHELQFDDFSECDSGFCGI